MLAEFPAAYSSKIYGRPWSTMSYHAINSWNLKRIFEFCGISDGRWENLIMNRWTLRYSLTGTIKRALEGQNPGELQANVFWGSSSSRAGGAFDDA
jgi:hypothetical protein